MKAGDRGVLINACANTGKEVILLRVCAPAVAELFHRLFGYKDQPIWFVEAVNGEFVTYKMDGSRGLAQRSYVAQSKIMIIKGDGDDNLIEESRTSERQGVVSK